MKNTRDVERLISSNFKSNSELKAPFVLDFNEIKRKDIFDLKLHDLKENCSKIIDIFDEMLLELMFVKNPKLKNYSDKIEENYKNFKTEYFGGLDDNYVGTWVYFSDGLLIHILSENDLYELRTSRNIGLFTPYEQQEFSKMKVAIGGLSVGGACALSLAMEGVKDFILVDFDRLATSNLNRISAGLSSVGEYKTDIISKKIWDIDPYTKILTDNRGFVEETYDIVFDPNNLPDVFIEAMDSLPAKENSRELCRNYKIPLIWMIDMGDGVVQLGVERYDLDPQYRPFHGSLEKKRILLDRELNYVEACFSIFNNEHLPFRMADSFLKACTNEGAGVSQIAGTINIAAGAIAKIAREIKLGTTLNNESFINVMEKIDPNYISKKQIDQEKTLEFMKKLGLVKG